MLKSLLGKSEGAHLLDAPQTPNISSNLRSSAGRLPPLRLPHLLGISPILELSIHLLLHVFSSIRGRVFTINARMKLPPIEVILSWPTPNYTNPVTRGDALLIVNSVLIALVVITVGLRMYTRLIIKRWFGIDDVFILLALVCTVHEL